jgi:hypothetical protein
MPTLQELSAKVDELQTALDEEQQQITDLTAQKDAAIASLETVVVDLTAQLADGGTSEERQAILDKLNLTITDLKSTAPPTE